MFTLIVLVAAGAFYSAYLNLKEVEKLTVVKGHIDDFYIENTENADCIILLKEYRQKFYVKSIVMEALEQQKLEYLNVGDLVYIYIEDEPFLDEKSVEIKQLQKGEEKFINIEIARSKEKSNAYMGIICGLFFLFGIYKIFINP